jgi:hypothetical protein
MGNGKRKIEHSQAELIFDEVDNMRRWALSSGAEPEDSVRVQRWANSIAGTMLYLEKERVRETSEDVARLLGRVHPDHVGKVLSDAFKILHTSKAVEDENEEKENSERNGGALQECLSYRLSQLKEVEQLLDIDPKQLQAELREQIRAVLARDPLPDEDVSMEQLALVMDEMTRWRASRGKR